MSVALLDEFGIGDVLTRTESWRYSKLALRALEQSDFVAADTDIELPGDVVMRFDWPQTRGVRAVFVNGGLSTRYSNLTTGRTASSSAIRLADGDALHVVFVHMPAAQATRWRHELSIDVEGRADWIEHHVGAAGQHVLGALTSTARIAHGGRLNATTISELPDSTSLYRREQVQIAGGGEHASTHALFGGRLQRFDLDVEMAGEQASYVSRGVFAPRGRQHIDVHLEARHAARGTRSDVLWRGVADQRGRGILHGAIAVAAGADGADAQLQTKNLLLSPHAEIDAQPVLEIYADEVKAAHGATVGQLDERALFYLRSRGVPLSMARNLLIAGFCREAFGLVEDAELRARLEATLAARLPQAEESSL